MDLRWVEKKFNPLKKIRRSAGLGSTPLHGRSNKALTPLWTVEPLD